MKLFYIGDNYSGFQIQPNKDTIHGRILIALEKAKLIEDKKSAGFGYSGRTDRYVHSIGQIIAFNTNQKLRIPEINSYLPPDIQFYAFTKTKSNFEPRYHAKYRHYKYFTFNEKLDISLMKEASKKFFGFHDFKILSKSPYPKKTIREIFKINIKEFDNRILCFNIIGRSFLYEMVRRIIFILLEIGKNRLDIKDIKKYLDIHNSNNLRIKPAPIKNGGELILYHCEYGLDFEYDNYSIEFIKKTLWNHLIDKCVKQSSFQGLYDYFENKI